MVVDINNNINVNIDANINEDINGKQHKVDVNDIITLMRTLMTT